MTSFIVLDINCQMCSTAFCPQDETNTTRGNYQWRRVPAEDVLTSYCIYGGIDGTNSLDRVRRNCSDRGIWFDVEVDQCLTYSNSLLINISRVSDYVHCSFFFMIMPHTILVCNTE